MHALVNKVVCVCVRQRLDFKLTYYYVVDQDLSSVIRPVVISRKLSKIDPVTMECY